MSFISDLINRITNLTRKRLPEVSNIRNEQNAVPSYKELSQYDYRGTLDWMKNNGMMEEYYQQLDILENESNYYYPSNVHGIDHTKRVTMMALILVDLDKVDEHTKKLLILAARYHDIGRSNDARDDWHGIDGAKDVERYGLLKDLSDKDKDVVKNAIAWHSMPREMVEEALSRIPEKERKLYKDVSDYLKDADALDRVRIANENMQLDPDRLRHASAKQLVTFAKENFINFNQVMSEYQNDRYLRQQDPEIQVYYEYIKDSGFDINWAYGNRDFLKEMYERGILQDLKATKTSLGEILEDPEKLGVTSQIQKGDFEALRKEGFNITYETFLDVVSKYKDGTLDVLRQRGRLSDIFSKRTFEKYGKKLTFDETLRPDYVSDEKLLEMINEHAYTTISDSTFESEYMLFRHLHENNPVAFDLYKQGTGIDISMRKLSGILEVLDLSDLNKFVDQGYNFSYKNILALASEFTPEEYKEIIQSGQLNKLIEYNPEKDTDNGFTYNASLNKLREVFPNLTEDDYRQNYKLYLNLSKYKKEIYDVPGIEKYSIRQIYVAVNRMVEAGENLSEFKNKELTFSGKDLLNLLEFSARTNLLSYHNESEKDDIIAILVENGEWVRHPTFINYVTKTNKVYRIEKPDEVLDYNNFCVDKILSDPKISVDRAKKALVNSLFRIYAPEGKYTKELEDNIINELYFYKKYKAQGKIKDEQNEVDVDQAISDLIAIFDSPPNINDFKRILAERRGGLSNIQFDTVYQKVQERMRQFSKEDIIQKLNETETRISSSETKFVTTTYGQKIPVKVLDGQDFVLASTTVMPKCSGMSRKLQYDRNKIINNMLNRPLNANNRCVSLINQGMIANSASAIYDNELRYGYVPESEGQLSIMGTHDLSSVKRADNRGNPIRVTTRATENRSTEDMIYGTTEEHNEAVFNGVVPRYIICLDQISDIAVKKYNELSQMYQDNNYGQPIEILCVNTKNKYLPRINEEWQQSINSIKTEIRETGTLSDETFERFFNKRERNITMQTIQAVNSSSYRSELWDERSNIDKFNQLADVLEEASQVVSREKLGDIASQLDLIIELTENSNDRFYDHVFKDQVERWRFMKIRDNISDRLEEKYMKPWEIKARRQAEENEKTEEIPVQQ